MTTLACFILVTGLALGISPTVRGRRWAGPSKPRLIDYIAALRPTVILGLLATVLPLTAMGNAMGSTMLGNLFVEYRFWEGFFFASPVLATMWALMMTAGLTLDTARASGSFPDLEPSRRRLTIPLHDAWVFMLFTLLALPAAIVVTVYAESPFYAALGMAAGGLLTYLVIDAGISVIRLADWQLRVLPWEPLLCRLLLATMRIEHLRWISFIPDRFIAVVSWFARRLPFPRYFFVDNDRNNPLEGDHVFLLWGLGLTFVSYATLYVVLGSEILFADYVDRLPPAGFVYLLLLLLTLLVSLPWILLGRYRILAYAFAVWLIFVSALNTSPIATASFAPHLFGRYAHTYDVYPVGDRDPLDTLAVLEPLNDLGDDPTLVVVAASGGGILAAGWTTKVLGELYVVYPAFRRELRLISAVSGGAVGTAHFVRAQPADGSALDASRLAEIVEQSTATSLAATAYGFAFPDLHRAFMPLLVPDFDRGRLQEARWKRTLDCGRATAPAVELLADWNDDIRAGTKPAVILNTTVLETGERIAITSLVSLRRVRAELAGRNSGWPGTASREGDEALPARRNGTRTLSEFLGGADDYTIDVWTGARLSATFSYVSPPARARLCTAPGTCTTEGGLDPDYARLHLIDGGYHDNYGVASALEWITRVVRYCEEQTTAACPFRRIALIEIRAKPVVVQTDAAPEWVAAWLGPPAGIMNSWAFAQTAANDTAIDRLIHELKRSALAIDFDAFVFQPPTHTCPGAPDAEAARRCCCGNCCADSDEKLTNDFPLSWHLSREQMQRINAYWRSAENQQTLENFLRFVGGKDERGSAAAHGAHCCHRIEHLQPFEGLPKCSTISERPDSAPSGIEVAAQRRARPAR